MAVGRKTIFGFSAYCLLLSAYFTYSQCQGS